MSIPDRIKNEDLIVRKSIFVKFQFEGEHYWADAPDEVAFLRNPHRHMFHVKVELQVFHDDRDIEFILFKRELLSLFKDQNQCNGKSCEMICDDIADYILEHYPKRGGFSVEVSEDGENGAIGLYMPWMD